MKQTRWFRQFRDLFPAAGLLAAIGWYSTRIETRRFQVRRLTLALPLLPPEFDGYRIVHVSDQHLGVRGADAVLPRVVQAINREAPDLVALTGDLITWSRQHNIQPETAAPLGDLRARDGVWAVLGNHDYVDPVFVHELYHAAGVTLLQNDAHTLQRYGAQIALLGLDDIFWGQPDLPAALAAVPDDSPAILMVHEPDFAPAAAMYPQIMLQLSGHTHGGQILPLGHALILPKLGRTYYRGLIKLRGMWLFVTNGTGTGRFAIRWNSRPEIAVITLRSPAPAQGVV